MSEQQPFTAVWPCPFCGNSAPMKIVVQHREYYSYGHNQLDLAGIYQLCLCPACSRTCLRYLNDLSDTIDVLYPQSSITEVPRGLPETVLREVETANRLRAIDPNAYAVSLGRVLELICKDRRAAGRTLEKMLQDLSSKNEIPERLVEVARGLRRMRNVGAHPSLGELSEAEVPVLTNLTRAILEYVYTAPLLVKEAEECLKRLRGKRPTED